MLHSAVSDEDEVGDRITVRSDEELKAMLSYVSMRKSRAYLIKYFFKVFLTNNVLCRFNNLLLYCRASWIRQYKLGTFMDTVGEVIINFSVKSTTDYTGLRTVWTISSV